MVLQRRVHQHADTTKYLDVKITDVAIVLRSFVHQHADTTEPLDIKVREYANEMCEISKPMSSNKAAQNRRAKTEAAATA